MFITDFVVFIDFHQIKNKIAQDGKGCKGHILLLLYNIHLSGSLSKSMTIKPNVIQSATDTCVTASLCFTVHIRGTWKSASSYIYFFSKMKPTVGTVPEVLFSRVHFKYSSQAFILWRTLLLYILQKCLGNSTENSLKLRRRKRALTPVLWHLV